MASHFHGAPRIARLRTANVADETAIDALMKASARSLFPAFYGERNTPSAVRYIAIVDRTLLEDGTYFVLEPEDQPGEIVACGGWSRRDKLFTGAGESSGGVRRLEPTTEPARVRAMFVREDWTRLGLGKRILEACEGAAREEGFLKLALMATLPGVPLYSAYGFRELERCELRFPDGVVVETVRMEKEIAAA